MKKLLIGIIILLAVADFVFWGGPSQLAQHLRLAIGDTAAGTAHPAQSIGEMISGASQNVGNQFKNALGK